MTIHTRPGEEVSSAQAAASGELVGAPVRVRGVYVRAAGTAGTLVLRDGGVTGTILLTINTPAAVGGHYHEIPGGGINFGTDCYAVLTTADAVTIYYAEGDPTIPTPA